MDEQIESWQNKIRDLAPLMQKAEYELLKSQARDIFNFIQRQNLGLLWAKTFIYVCWRFTWKRFKKL